MEGSARKTLKKTTTTQFEVLVKEMERNPDLARGVAVFGSDRGRVEERWEEIMRKINSHGPPTRTAVEWKKIWADLKSRTKKKIAENTRSLTATGGGPFRHSPLSEMEQTIDSLVFISRSAAPSGRVFGIPSTATSNASRHSSIEEMPPLLVPESPTLDERRQPTTLQSPIRHNQPPPVGVVTPTTQTTRPTPTHTLRSTNRKRTFQETVAESAKIQAEAAKVQAEAAKKMAEASMLQVEATNKLTAAVERQSAIFEKFLEYFHN
ncbi:PREDICTED: uncharacterized protein LOC108360661 isoform X1 [Rhagoletis zephyria]|uniref:uncharacterized protein LOC108360661 isoform X1 n=2 Tax=Rhagoletis TaxID=28609 RepID=UPI0008116EA9|nr:PREDICTED: uncharacterized protein LOC108360661 isoform X1 [Rhagoletis zephyria]